MNNPHKNARTTPLGRAEMIRRIVEDGRPVAEVAAGFGISERRSRTWLARWRAEGAAGLGAHSLQADPEGSAQGKILSPSRKRACVDHVRSQLPISATSRWTASHSRHSTSHRFWSSGGAGITTQSGRIPRLASVPARARDDLAASLGTGR